MDQLYGEKPDRKLGGGLKDRPQCERCGRPVKIDSEDYLHEEILCAHCASDATSSELVEDEQ